MELLCRHGVPLLHVTGEECGRIWKVFGSQTGLPGRFGTTGALALFNILHTGGEQRKGLSPVLLFPVTFTSCGLDFEV